MDFKERIESKVAEVVALAKAQGKLSGFTIGNTAKVDTKGMYLTPLRDSTLMVCAGVVVYSEQQAVDVSKLVDGRVDYILVDAEKKVSDENSCSGEPANVERAVREEVKRSKLWIYKGNDIAVDAVDLLVTYLTKDDLRGIGGSKVAILGAGNLGSKLALRFVERGAEVYLTRRDENKLNVIAEALNYIKPTFTRASVHATTDNAFAASNARVLVGVSQGYPVITREMVMSLAENAILIDVGKGTLFEDAIQEATQRDIEIFRLDITAAFDGLISQLCSIENIVENCMGRREFEGETLVSGGLLGHFEDVIVDNINNPTTIYGMSNGLGDFLRSPSNEQKARLQNLKRSVQSKDA